MTKAIITSPLVSIQWLADHFDAENLVILDARMKPIIAPVNSAPEDTTCIRGAMRFDFDGDICDKSTGLPHMMPSVEVFTEKVKMLGINKDSAIVAYDNIGIYSSPRAWWMFRAMGHEQVAVLDGGLPAWKNAGFDCGEKAQDAAKHRGDFVAHPKTDSFLNSANVLNVLKDPRFAILDARSEGRFKGTEPEPRPSLRSGHIPNSISLPHAAVQENGFMLTPDKLSVVFSKLVKKDQNLIFSCGSGVTSCVDALAAELAGYSKISVYDGSWTEWGSETSGLPVIK